jgi:predicted ATP-dependent endonuclease of OLD family
MFIKSITIKNFRCFDKGIEDKGTKIKLNEEGITAFIGRNGSGKTTVLEALNYLIGQDYLPTEISEKDFHYEANDIKDEIFIEGETVSPFFLNVDAIDNNGSPITVVVPCNKIKLTIKRREKASQVLNDSYIPEKTVVPIIGKIDDKLYQGEKFKKLYYPIISLEEVDSDIPDLESAKEIIKNLLKEQSIETKYFEKYYQVKYKLKSHQGEIKDVDFPEYSLKFNANKIKGFVKSYYLTKNRDNDVSGNYSFISKILTDLHWKYKREESKNKKNEEKIKEKIQNKEIPILEQYNNLSESLRNIIDKKEELIKKINNEIQKITSENKDFQIDFIDIEQPYQSAFISKNEAGKILLPDNLGSGFNILIAYALFSYVANKEKIPIVLIIDEPELHLHSDWQKKMYDTFVKQTNLQIIYSTQSPYFIDPDLIGNVFRFENKKEEGAKVFQLKDCSDFKIKNLFNLENREIFFAKNIVLVEGIQDRFRFRKFLQKENKDFFVINGLGYLEIAKKVCGDLKINFQVIVDLDYLEKFDECLPNLTEEELEKLDEVKILNSQIEKIKDEKTKKVLEKFRNKIQKDNKICLSSKILLKIESDENYKKIVDKKIEDLKKENIFVLQYGMLENYLDKNGEIIDNKKEEKEKELKSIFEIK